MNGYDHQAIEKKWQARWKSDQSFDVTPSEEREDNYYLLVEFPYPSGNLHIGHWYAFAVPDIYARLLRMRGKQVLFPIGFDAFGLPAENAAIKHNVDPKEWTFENIKRMREQLQSMGASFHWNREVVTADASYYRWTQWLFTKFYKEGLAYKKQSLVNWCASCQTVLANEQVIDGACERCDTEVTKRNLDQWFFNIRAYAERLLDDLDDLNWPEQIKESQRKWIGKSAGATIHFSVKETDETIPVFTTRPDTLFGVTHLVLAPEHPFVENVTEHVENKEAVAAYRKEVEQKSDLYRQQQQEKSGVQLEGVSAVHPATGAHIPVWIADYVLPQYGTGAVMAVPAHDKRDYDFATTYNIEPIEVIDEDDRLINSEEFSGMHTDEATEKITTTYGEETVTYKLRDWLLSRQRYWGCPIPIVYDPEGNPHPVSDEHLPWILPEDVDHTPTGEAPLARSEELQARVEKIFGEGWTPEVDTMDTFVDSSWYFLRYLDPDNEETFSAMDAQKQWMPVDRYSGGAEHTTMHLLYSRFFYKAMYDMGLVTEREPYKERFNRSLILGPDGHKMSKSKGNVADPDEHVRRVGADTVRMYLAFVGPYNEVSTYPWDLGGVAGVRRFLERVWKLHQSLDDAAHDELTTVLNQTIKKVGEDIGEFKFNTAISQLMSCLNEAEEYGMNKAQYKVFLLLLAVFAPHMTEELWERVGESYSIHQQPWPSYDAQALVSETVTIAVQVNGKVRATIEVDRDLEEDKVKEQALAVDNVRRYVEGADIQRIIYVPHKLINIVIS